MDQDEMDIDEFKHEVQLEIEANIQRFPENHSDWFRPAPPIVDTLLDTRLARLLKAVSHFLRRSAHEIAMSNEKVIEELSDHIQNVLLCIPSDHMPTDVNNAYLKLLDSLAEVRFPVTILVNHVVVVALRQVSTISKYFSDIVNPDETIKLSYFLKHAHDSQHGFSLKGFRLSDIVLNDFSRDDCPRALLEILRYGCCDLLKKNGNMRRLNWRDIGCSRVSEYGLLDTLQFFLSLQPYLVPMTREEFHEKADCLKIIFRSIHTFTFEQLYAISEFNEFLDLKHYKEYGMALLQKTVNFPEVNERIGKAVPSLKHICRFQIRKVLYENWSLPDGIRTLEIPVCLQEYLDLKTD